MKCELCGENIVKYRWEGIPLLEDKLLCDGCALAQLKGWIEDNGPECSAEAASHYAEYKQLSELLKTFKKDI
jgi:hypothetical protein